MERALLATARPEPAAGQLVRVALTHDPRPAQVGAPLGAIMSSICVCVGV